MNLLSRRAIVIAASTLLGSAFLPPSFSVFAQSRHKSLPDPPLPGDPQQRDKLTTPTDPKSAETAARRQREESFRAGIERLHSLTGELREELKRAPAADVLSVKMYKRLQEIEKLAKQLESAVKG